MFDKTFLIFDKGFQQFNNVLLWRDYGTTIVLLWYLYNMLWYYYGIIWCLYVILWYYYGIIMVARLHHYCICIIILRYCDATSYLEHRILFLLTKDSLP